MFGIIGAMKSEIELLKESLEGRQETAVAGRTVYTGRINGAEAAVMECGIGKVMAAMCAQLLIDRFGATRLINTGVAGGVGHGLRVGDFVIGESLVQHDFDVSALGYPKGYAFLGEPDGMTVYHSDAELIELFVAASADVLAADKIVRGRIASGDVFVASGALKERLRDSYGAVAAEMEGAAIGCVAQANGVPFIVVRALSDLADEEANISYEEFEKESAAVSAAIVKEMLAKFSERSLA